MKLPRWEQEGYKDQTERFSYALSSFSFPLSLFLSFPILSAPSSFLDPDFLPQTFTFQRITKATPHILSIIGLWVWLWVWVCHCCPIWISMGKAHLASHTGCGQNIFALWRQSPYFLPFCCLWVQIQPGPPHSSIIPLQRFTLPMVRHRYVPLVPLFTSSGFAIDWITHAYRSTGKREHRDHKPQLCL